MAAPTDAGRATTNVTSSSLTWNVNYPASIGVSDYLVIFARIAGTQSLSMPAGWTAHVIGDTSDATDDVTYVWGKVAVGTETGTLAVSAPVGGKGAVIMWRITGHNGGIWLPVPTPATYTTSANTANPPASGTMTSDDYLVLALAGHDGETSTFTAAPTNYVNLASANSGTGGAVATNCIIAGASRQLTAITSEDPGTFTHGAASNGGTALTIAIRQLVPRSADFKEHRITKQAVNRAASW